MLFWFRSFCFQWYSLLIIESNNATRSFLVHTEDRKKIRATKQHKFAARPIKVNIAAQSYCCHVLLVTSSNIRRTKKPHPHTQTHTHWLSDAPMFTLAVHTILNFACMKQKEKRANADEFREREKEIGKRQRQRKRHIIQKVAMTLHGKTSHY